MSYDTSIIRTRIGVDDIQLRGRQVPPNDLKAIRKGLLTLHTLELMATNIYKFQVTKEQNEHNRQLIAAMCNEMTHYQDYQVKIYEYGWRPNIFRWAYWIVGAVLGFSSRIRGREALLKTDIWLETRAVKEYGELLRSIDWDDDTRKVIEKNQADEDSHVKRWQRLLDQGK